MPNTKIPLRGMTRVPTDRLANDGWCAESLNVVLNAGELVPTVPATKVTPTGFSSLGMDVFYIHKGASYTNYVGLVPRDYHTYIQAYNTTHGTLSICEITLGATVVSATNIGNILICTLSDGTARYAVFDTDNNVYKDLGDKDPVPQVKFEVTPQTADDLIGKVSILEVNDPNYPNALALILNQLSTTKEAWDKVLELTDGVQSLETAEQIAVVRQAGKAVDGLNRMIWEKVEEDMVKNRQDNVFSAPVLVCYALRLYDGSYIYQSAPVMLAGSTKNMSVAEATLAYGTGGWFEFYARLNHVFKATVTISLTNATNWENLIESVDVFLSTNINAPKLRAKLTTAEAVVPDDVPTGFDTTNILGYARANYEGAKTIILDNGAIAYDQEAARSAFEEDMLEKANFYLLKSFSVDNLPTGEELVPVSQDDLVVKKTMPMGDGHFVSPTGMLSSYNNRLLSVAQLTTLSAGHPDPMALVPDSDTNEDEYAMIYVVREPNGIEHRVLGFVGDYVDTQMRAFITYPDPRCVRAYLFKKSSLTQTYTSVVFMTMKEHPRLNCSYGFWGMDRELFGYGTILDPTDDRTLMPNTSGNLFTTQNTYSTKNVLALSEVDNPFVFQPEQRKMFQSEIIEAAPVTIALSSGQFGHFPLYVFTRDGIWAIALDSAGGIATTHPVSRDVAIDGTIRQLDQAIVFVSEQGVMLLAGAQVKNISTEMDGKNFVPDNDLIAVIQSFSPDSVLSDSTPFLSFVKGSKPAYDYAGKRILFFSDSHPTFQYVYSLASQTWHRVKLSGTAPGAFCVLNSYPDCLVFFRVAGTGAHGGDIMNLSTLLDANATSSALPGLIVTRDINLGGDDVYKTIKRVYVRGDRYPEAAPWKYVLLGSNDRKHYHVLHSLRGPSWKFYRIAIITKMQQGGRISYVELDWEPRFTDRIR